MSGQDDPPLFRIVKLQDGTEGVMHISSAAAHKLAWSGIGRGYETREELEREEHLITCHICGQESGTHYVEGTARRLRETQTCFTCDFWLEKIRWEEQPVPDHKPVRVDGRHYCYDPRRPVVRGDDAKWLGHGGRVFKVAFLDTADVVEVNNLWHQGEIPERFRARLHDNALFLT